MFDPFCYDFVFLSLNFSKRRRKLKETTKKTQAIKDKEADINLRFLNELPWN